MEITHVPQKKIQNRRKEEEKEEKIQNQRRPTIFDQTHVETKHKMKKGMDAGLHGYP